MSVNIQPDSTVRIFFRILTRPAVIFFSMFLLTGLLVYDDYGLSYDEETSRVGNGYINYNFIQTHEEGPLAKASEKYHGPAFEIFLVFAEKLFKRTDDRSIFLCRHLLTFLLFFTGVIFFYCLALNYFRNKSAALLTCLVLVLSPRIFADGFYNSKDMAFLSVFIPSIYFLIRFVDKQVLRSVFLHALVTGILVDIRITGIIVPAFTVLILLTNTVLKPGTQKSLISIAWLFLYL